MRTPFAGWQEEANMQGVQCRGKVLGLVGRVWKSL